MQLETPFKEKMGIKIKFAVHTKKIYFCRKQMKALFFKLGKKIFDRSISKRYLLKNQLAKESKLTSKDSMKVLHEFEKLSDAN